MTTRDARVRSLEFQQGRGRMPPLTIVLSAETDQDEADFAAFASRQPPEPLRIRVRRVDWERPT